MLISGTGSRLCQCRSDEWVWCQMGERPIWIMFLYRSMVPAADATVAAAAAVSTSGQQSNLVNVLYPTSASVRGVQYAYMYCIMNKCIMVKIGGRKNT